MRKIIDISFEACNQSHSPMTRVMKNGLAIASPLMIMEEVRLQAHTLVGLSLAGFRMYQPKCHWVW
ncbi:MAG: hypothetical protein RIR73_2944 [Chloroflexota bacterium]